MSEPKDTPEVTEGSKEPESGVDPSLVAWMLSLTPLERLAYLQGQVDSILALRNSGPAK